MKYEELTVFETYLDGEKSYPYMNSSEGEKLWDSIQSDFHMYRFIVKVNSPSKDGSISKTFLIDSVEKLLDFKKKKKFKILNLYLLHSGLFGCSEDWKIEELTKVWETIEPNMKDEQLSYIFLLKDHSKYVISSLSTPEAELLNKKLIIKIKK